MNKDLLLYNIKSRNLSYPYLDLFSQMFDRNKVVKAAVSASVEHVEHDFNLPIFGYTGQMFVPTESYVSTLKNYEDFDFLSEMMLERRRSTSRKEDRVTGSMLDTWSRDDFADIIASKISEKNTSPLTYREVRQIYDDTLRALNIVHPMVFRVSWVKGILNELFPEKDPSSIKMIDPMAESGETTLAASLLGLHFDGYLTGSASDDHIAVINTFGDPEKQVLQENVEEFSVSESLYQKYDVCFTSFSADELPFTTKYVSRVVRNLLGSWKTIKNGGYLVFHVNDFRRLDVVDMTHIMIEQIFPRSSWVKAVSLVDEKTGAVYMAYIWKKDPVERKILFTTAIPQAAHWSQKEELSTRPFALHYPDVRDRIINSLIFQEIQEKRDEKSTTASMVNTNFVDGWNIVNYAIEEYKKSLSEADKIVLDNIFPDPWILLGLTTILDPGEAIVCVRKIYSMFKGTML